MFLHDDQPSRDDVIRARNQEAQDALAAGDEDTWRRKDQALVGDLLRSLLGTDRDN